MICPVIKYNGYTFPNVYGPYTFSYTPTDFVFSCNFLIQKATSGAVITEEERMLDAVKEVKKALSISFNGSSAQDLRHDTTGFNARVTVSKIKDVGLSTATSRAYSLSCTAELPYTQDAGKIQANMVIQYDSSKVATAIFTMVYSASSSANSRATTVYAADTWDLTMLSTFLEGKVMELVNESISQDQNYKRAIITKVYKEVIFEEATTSLAQNSIVSAEYSYEMRYIPVRGVVLSSTSSEEQLPLLLLSLRFVGKVDKSLTSSTGLTDLYNTDIKRTMIDKAASILKLTAKTEYSEPAIFLLQENLNVNPSSSEISATIEVGCKSSKTHIATASESVVTIVDKGINYIKLWDGKQNTYYMYSLGETRLMVRTIIISQITDVPSLPPLANNWNLLNGTWVLLKSIETYSASRQGVEQTLGSTKLVPYTIHTKSFVETYLCVETAGSVSAVIGGTASGGVF